MNNFHDVHYNVKVIEVFDPLLNWCLRLPLLLDSVKPFIWSLESASYYQNSPAILTVWCWKFPSGEGWGTARGRSRWWRLSCCRWWPRPQRTTRSPGPTTTSSSMTEDEKNELLSICKGRAKMKEGGNNRTPEFSLVHYSSFIRIYPCNH